MEMAECWHPWIWWILAGLPLLLAADALMGLAYRTNTSAGLTVIAPRSGRTHRAFVVLPGYIMSGEPLARAFAPHLQDDDAMVVVSYADRGLDVSQIYGTVMGALRTLRPVELRVYGASMGGMVSKLFLDHYRQDGAPYGKVILILDSAPSGRNGVKRPPFVLDFCCWYRGGPLSSAV